MTRVQTTTNEGKP